MYRDRVQQQAGTGEQLLLSPQTVPKILYKFLLVGEFGQKFVLVLRKVIGKQLIRIIQLKKQQYFRQQLCSIQKLFFLQQAEKFLWNQQLQKKHCGFLR